MSTTRNVFFMPPTLIRFFGGSCYQASGIFLWRASCNARFSQVGHINNKVQHPFHHWCHWALSRHRVVLVIGNSFCGHPALHGSYGWIMSSTSSNIIIWFDRLVVLDIQQKSLISGLCQQQATGNGYIALGDTRHLRFQYSDGQKGCHWARSPLDHDGTRQVG